MTEGRRWMSAILALVFVASGCGGAGDGADGVVADNPTDAIPGLPGAVSPTDAPSLLAPGLVNSGVNTRDVAMTPDGREMYYCMASAGYRYAVILVTRLVDGAWTEPEVAPFSGSTKWIDLEPFIAPDGQRLFFMSTRPNKQGQSGEADIWVMDRQGDRWSKPWNLGAPVNTSQEEYFPAVRVTRSGLLAMHASGGNGSKDIWWVDMSVLQVFR